MTCRLLHLTLFSPHLASIVRHIPLIPLLPVFALLAVVILLMLAGLAALLCVLYAAALTANTLARDELPRTIPMPHEHLRRALYLFRFAPLRSLGVRQGEAAT
jgi:hypothetical protein